MKSYVKMSGASPNITQKAVTDTSKTLFASMTRKLVALFAATALALAFASCSSDSSDDGTPNLPVTPQQTEQQESQAQKNASESYKIGDTTYTVENGKVTITNTDGSKKEVGSISSDGVITITQGGTTTKISTAKAENSSITTSVAIETKNADGTIVTKTYTGNLNNGTLTNKDNPNDTLTIKKTDSAQAADNTKKPAEDTESKPAEATANQTAADAVIAKISSIGTVTYTAEIKAKIDEVRAAYNALSEAQKALVSAETLALLTNAESSYSTQKAAADETATNQTAADAVIAKINAIGTVTYTAESKTKIDEVRAAYNALSEAQKALVSAETLALLTNAESTYNTQKAAADETAANQAAANAVITKINAIGTVTYTAESKAKIDEVRSAYNALNDAQKALVSAETLAVLTNAESTYTTQKAAADETATNQAAADAVIAKISSIGTVTYTTESKAKIDDARTAYDALNDAQKALVSAETLAVLTNAESTYTTQKAAADEAAANAVITKINAIGTVAYTTESKAKIDEARSAYNALTEAQKALVTNYSTLTVAESTYASLASAGEISVSFVTDYSIGITKTEDDANIILTAESGFTGYKWLFEGYSIEYLGEEGIEVSTDGTVLKVGKWVFMYFDVCQIAVSATKDGILYSAQIPIKETPNHQ